VLILKIDKVLCFHALLQVLVLKVLKIVQIQVVPAYGEWKTNSKAGPKSKNASKMLALRDGTLYYLRNILR
jgi:hypothetical protein